MTDLQKFLEQGGDAVRNQLTAIQDVGVLRAVLRAETAGKARPKVLEKVEQRLRKVGGREDRREEPRSESDSSQSDLRGHGLVEASENAPTVQVEAPTQIPLLQPPLQVQPEQAVISAPEPVEQAPEPQPEPDPEPVQTAVSKLPRKKRVSTKADRKSTKPSKALKVAKVPADSSAKRARRQETRPRRPRSANYRNEIENGVVVRGTCCVCDKHVESHEEVVKVFGLREVPRKEGKVLRRQPQCKGCRKPEKAQTT